MLFDTHCHPYYRKHLSEKDVFSDFIQNGGKLLVSIGIDIETSIQSIELAKTYDVVYASIGIQPIDGIKNLNLEKTIHKLSELYDNNKNTVVGIGECGLDYHWINDENLEEEKKLQKAFFRAQIQLAKRLHLPFIIHNRDAKDDMYKILTEEGYGNFIMHCFSEDYEYAQKLINKFPDCMISFSGIVTFKNALAIQETAKKIHLKNIIIETDSPFLTPVPFRGKEENKPSYVKYVLEKLIELRSEPARQIENQIFENSKNIFNLK